MKIIIGIGQTWISYFKILIYTLLLCFTNTLLESFLYGCCSLGLYQSESAFQDLMELKVVYKKLKVFMRDCSHNDSNYCEENRDTWKDSLSQHYIRQNVSLTQFLVSQKTVLTHNYCWKGYFMLLVLGVEIFWFGSVCSGQRPTIWVSGCHIWPPFPLAGHLRRIPAQISLLSIPT